MCMIYNCQSCCFQASSTNREQFFKSSSITALVYDELMKFCCDPLCICFLGNTMEASKHEITMLHVKLEGLCLLAFIMCLTQTETFYVDCITTCGHGPLLSSCKRSYHLKFGSWETMQVCTSLHTLMENAPLNK